MATVSHRIRRLKSRSSILLRDLWEHRRRSPRPLADPLHCQVPTLRDAEIAAVYHAQRIAGDFYEFVRVSPCRVLFALLDVAGRRADTRDVLIALQDTFRTFARTLFAPENVNEAEAMSQLCHHINDTVLQCSGGVRSCPGFIGCYNENLGTICYGNAGHTPGILIDPSGAIQLEATGLPLGLFSHGVHGSSTCALVPGAVLLIVSRGLSEIVCNGEGWGLEGVLHLLQHRSHYPAVELCSTIVQTAQKLVRGSPIQNDLTAVALVRSTRVQGPGLVHRN